MFLKIKRFLGLKGTWEWACEQMKKGEMVRRISSTGSVHLRLDKEAQGRIQWSFEYNDTEWQSANVFLHYFEATDWTTYNPKK